MHVLKIELYNIAYNESQQYLFRESVHGSTAIRVYCIEFSLNKERDLKKLLHCSYFHGRVVKQREAQRE